MKYTTYNPETGQILTVLTTNDPALAELNLVGKSYLVGEYNSQQYYIDNNIAVEKPGDPSTQLLPYTFNYVIKEWEIDTDKCGNLVRRQRDSDLGLIDRINPVRYNSLTDEQKSELATYRQALLDVPQQSGFPTSIVWPAKPTWL